MSTPTEQTLTNPPKTRGWIFLFLFLILLLAGTIILSYPLGQQFTRAQEELHQQVNILNTQVATLQTELQLLQSQDSKTPLATLQTRFNDLSKQQQRLDNALTSLAHQIKQQPQTDDDWKLAEINYLLTIAQHRLQLAHDPEGALVALTAANERLQRLNNSALLPVKTQLLQDIKRLRELKRPDIARLAMLLAQYLVQVDNLPLRQETRKTDTPQPSEPAPTDEQPWQAHMPEELKQPVVRRDNNEADTAFLISEQRSLTAQILQLKLENARFFLLRRDTQNFAASIAAVLDWLNRYYDKNDNKVKALQNALADMQNLVLNPQLPDISGSLNLLQRLSASASPLVGVH
jgi:uroporphyrin-3 C-methyltransferase